MKAWHVIDMIEKICELHGVPKTEMIRRNQSAKVKLYEMH